MLRCILASVALVLPLPSLAKPLPNPPQLNLEHDFVLLQPTQSRPEVPFVTTDDQPWQVIYLNFDGETLKGSPANSNSKTNETSLVGAASFDYPALSDASWKLMGDRQKGTKDIIDFLKLIFIKYAVKFETTRPTDGDYTMAMIGGDGQGTVAGGSAIGVSPMDGPPKYPKCGNSNRNDIVFVFGDKISNGYGGQLAKAIALVTAHELGHSFGLEHVTDPTGIMYPQAKINPILQWVTAPVSEGICGEANQDADQALLDRLGKGEQDTTSPLVWFKRPGAGAILPPDFSFEVAAGDDLGVHHVEIFLDGKSVLSLSDPPYTQALTNIADGEHTLKAEVYDWAKLKGSTTVTFTVSSKCVLDGNCFAGKGGLSSECTTGDDCDSGVCAQAGGGPGLCVESCDVVKPICPKTTKCQEVAGTSACLPEGSGWSLDTSGDGGGCSVARPGSSLPPLAVLLFGVVLFAIRRRSTRY